MISHPTIYIRKAREYLGSLSKSRRDAFILFDSSIKYHTDPVMSKAAIEVATKIHML